MNYEPALAMAFELKSGDIYGSRPRRIDVNPSQYSNFEDDVWRLDPIVFGAHNRTSRLNFLNIPSVHRGVTKQLMFALLVAESPVAASPPSASTIVGAFSRIRAFTAWIETSGRGTVGTLGRADLDAYRLHLQSASSDNRDSLTTARLRAVRLFYLYREHLDESLSFDPNILDGWNGRVGRRKWKGENRTPRIPEEVSMPLIEWATRFVSDFAEDILQAREECIWLALRGRKVPAELRKQQTSAERAAAVEEVVDRYVAAGRPLPASICPPFNDTLKVNLNHIAREASACIESTRAQEAVRAAVSVVGIDSGTYIWHENQSPILREIAGRFFAYEDVPRWSQMLVTASYIVVAFYSGMRDSEIKSLRRGCIRVDRDSTGSLEIVRILGLAFKGETSPSGVPATWVVGAPVKIAIRVMETIRSEDKDELLFAPLREGGQAPRSLGRLAISNLTTIRHLNHFLGWVNTYAEGANRADLIPDVDGKEWRLNTKQFRRTLAWYIARRPGGSIAGAIQYRQNSLQMFEGYAGTSQSGFRAEVESEEAIRRGEYLLEIASGQHIVTGPAAAIAQTRAEAFAAKTSFSGVVVDNEYQLERFVRSSSPQVFPGDYVMCVFDPAKALCARKDPKSPNQAKCQPLACRNGALDEGNRQYWEEQHASLTGALGSELSPYVRVRLAKRLDDIDRLLVSGGGA
ncbi:hypothetical protein [Cryobacterium zhongshanensis]|uniref:Core-binding (CB) domain-containing protein n=1 Tax=Cryobacterium zhongshanensis TaxID=2928153 RepID=A0AA41UJT3_9MICO|nr:hypothetical protein [Cryobacterium zhongshanensis]MCI4657321.1 hypothetical protein [Cryobacterium zhongshanensis]